MHIKNLLVGENIKLTAIKKSDIDIIEQWYSDNDFLRHYDMTSAIPRNTVEIEKILDGYNQDNTKYIFAIRIVEEDKLIGVCGFENILWNNGTAVIFIGLGDKSYRGRGYGKTALSLAIEFGFQELNFHRIQLNVLQYNKRAIELYEKLNFKKEGIYREFIHRDGKRHDMYLYGLLRREWEINNK